jgi:phospholipid/cholesterol/gamma-HCH transport system substrate-binding protein
VSRAREFSVGLVILAAITVGVVGTLWLKGTNWGRPSTEVDVLLSDVAQLAPGNGVKFRGVQIGRVAEIAVEPDGQAVRVRLQLQESVNLPSDAVVLLSPESFFGSWQAEIIRRDRYPSFPFYDVSLPMEGDVRVLGGWALPELSRLSAAAEQISANLADLTERLGIAFNEETAADLARAIENFGVLSDDLRRLVDQQSAIALSVTSSADSALTEIELATRVARRSFERIDELLADAQIDSIVTNVRLATGHIQTIAEDLAGSSDGFASTLGRADSTLARLDRLSARVEAGEGTLGRLLADTTFAIRAEGVLGQLDLLLQDLRENPRRYVRLSIF